jgi:hypothetical protein
VVGLSLLDLATVGCDLFDDVCQPETDSLTQDDSNEIDIANRLSRDESVITAQTQSITDRLQAHVDQAAADFDDGTIGLSAKQERAPGPCQEPGSN